MIWILFLLTVSPMQEQLCEAHHLYELGRPNEALGQYREVAEQGESGELCYNLGACCLQLDETVWALYYFARGSRLVPSDKQLLAQADKARSELGLGPLPRSLPIGKREFLMVLAVISGLALLLGSAAIWSHRPALRRWTLSLLACGGLLYGGVIYAHLFAPAEGMMIRSSVVQRGGERVALVPAGTLVKVIRSGEELLIQTEQGDRGSVAPDSVQLLR